MHRTDYHTFEDVQQERNRFVRERALRSYQLSNAQGLESACLLRLPSVWVGLGHQECAQVAEASNHKEWMTAVVVLSAQSVLVNSYRSKAGDVLVVQGQRDLRIACPASGFALFVSIPRSLWEARFNTRLGQWLPLNSACVWSVLNHSACEKLSILAAQVRHLADTRNFYSNRTQVMEELDQLLINELVYGLPQGGEVLDLGSAPRCSTRARLVDRALLFCQTQHAHRLAVSTVVQALHTSTRTLEYAFTEILGITPKQYLMRSQMNRIRWALQSSSSGALRVKNVLGYYGVTNLGRFAAEYKQLFSETPAQTLRGSSGYCEQVSEVSESVGGLRDLAKSPK